MILLIYNEMVCREELLPNVYDTDYRVRLHKSIYSLHDDITLQLERTAAGWTLRSGQDYQVFSQIRSLSGMLLKGTDPADPHPISGEPGRHHGGCAHRLSCDGKI